MSSTMGYMPVGKQDNSSNDLEHAVNSNQISDDASDVDDNINPELQKEGRAEQRSLHGLPWALLVAGVASSMFFYCLDKSVTTILIPVIVGELGEESKLPWVFIGFGLGSLSLTLPIGKIYEMFNAKTLYLVFLTIFMFGSALCGAAWNMNTLIIGRVLAGVGGIGVYTGIMTILTSVTTKKERPVYLGVIGLFWSIGRVVGPLFGGILGKNSWRWAFYINLLVCAIFAPVYIYLLPSISPKVQSSLHERYKSFDSLGLILSMCAIISAFTTINSGGTRWPWFSLPGFLVWAIAMISAISFAAQQVLCIRISPQDRLFPVNMVYNRKVLLVATIAVTSSITGFVPTNFISLYFQFTRGDSPMDAAFRLLPMIIAMTLVMPASGYFTSKIGHLEWWPIIGTLIALPGLLFMVGIEVDTTPASIYVSEALIGAGMGCYLQLPYTLVGLYISEDEKQEAMSLIIISQVGSIAFSMAAASAIFTNLAKVWLTDLLPGTPAAVIEGLFSGTSGSLKDIPSARLDDVLIILVTAIQPAWIISLLAGVAGLAATVLLLVLRRVKS